MKSVTGKGSVDLRVLKVIGAIYFKISSENLKLTCKQHKPEDVIIKFVGNLKLQKGRFLNF